MFSSCDSLRKRYGIIAHYSTKRVRDPVTINRVNRTEKTNENVDYESNFSCFFFFQINKVIIRISKRSKAYLGFFPFLKWSINEEIR